MLRFRVRWVYGKSMTKTSTTNLSDDAMQALISVGTNRQGAKVRLTWQQVSTERELRDAGLIGPSNGLTRTGAILRERIVNAAMEASF